MRQNLRDTARIAVIASLWGVAFSVLSIAMELGLLAINDMWRLPARWAWYVGAGSLVGFSLLTYGGYRRPKLCGLLGSLAFVPWQVVSAIMLWRSIRTGRFDLSLHGSLFWVLPILLHFGLMCSTVLLCCTPSGAPRSTTDVD